MRSKKRRKRKYDLNLCIPIGQVFCRAKISFKDCTAWIFYAGIFREFDYIHENLFLMRTLFYLLAAILVLFWLLGVFLFALHGLVHLALALGIIFLLLGLFRRE